MSAVEAPTSGADRQEDGGLLEAANAGSRSPGPVDCHVGGRLRLARRARNLDSRRFAQALGVSKTALFFYETGAQRLALARLHQAAVLLEVEVAFFFEGLPPHPVRNLEELRAVERAVAPFDAVDQATFRVANALRKLPERDRTSLAVLVEGMVENGPTKSFRPGRKVDQSVLHKAP